MASYRNLVTTMMIWAMLVAVNGKYFGNHKTASKKGNELDPATSRLLQKQTQIDKRRTNLHSKTTASANFSSPQMIRAFVLSKFNSEIVKLFTFLPTNYRCDVLRNLTRTSQCSSAFITHILRGVIRNSSTLKCPSRTQSYNMASKCSGRNITKVVLGEFWNQLGKLFDSISIPFQCNIVNRISSTSSKPSKRRRLRQNHFLRGRAPRVSLQVVEKELEKRFPFLNLKQNCSRVWKPLKDKVPPKSPAALVNVTVQLTRGTRKKAWIRRFKKRAHLIYMIYYNYHLQTKRQRPLIGGIGAHPSNPPQLSSNRVRMNVIKVTKINRQIVAIFAMEVKKPGSIRYNKVTPAQDIIKPLQTVGATALRRLFGGTVAHLSGRKSDSDKDGYKWLEANTKKANHLFPKHLVSYYKGLDRLGRCLVMLYISSILKLELRPVEMYYTSLEYVPKKYFCSSQRNPSTKVSVELLYRANDTRPIKTKTARPNKTLKDKALDKVHLINTGRLNVTVSEIPPGETLDGLEPEETEEQPETRLDVTPLEIGLFVVLALLCVAILVFTINCVIFAVKKKSACPEDEPNTAFGQAVWLRKVENHKSKVENETHLQIAQFTREDCRYMKTGRENVKRCFPSTQDRDPHGTRGKVSLDDATLQLSNNNEYSEDPLSSTQNLQKVMSSEQNETDVTQQTCENRDSDKTDNDDNDTNSGDNNDNIQGDNAYDDDDNDSIDSDDDNDTDSGDNNDNIQSDNAYDDDDNDSIDSDDEDDTDSGDHCSGWTSTKIRITRI